MPVVDELTILVKAEVDRAISDLDKMEKQSSKTRSTLALLRDAMQGPVAAGKMVAQTFRMLKTEVDKMEAAWKTQEMAVSNLNAVLRSTGGSVGRTSEELQKMASSLQEVTVFGDEAIISMNAVLLGFRSITGDTFDRTTKAILDMSTVMGTDLVSSANMLGKALDSPTQGMSALSRVGFVWTQEQKDMVKQMEASGDLLGAQTIILEEVEKAFGGAAKAAGETGSAVKMKLANAISDLNEQIGRSLTENMKPWRQAWLNMATAIGAALKAQNDFKESLEKESKGTQTTADKILIAEQRLAIFQKDRISTNDTMLQKSLDAQILGQQDLIRFYKEEARQLQIAKNAQDAAAKAAAEAAAAEERKKARNQEAWQLSQDALKTINEAEEAERRRLITFGESIDYQALSNLAWQESEKLITDSNGLISNANPLYRDIVAKALEYSRAADEAARNTGKISDEIENVLEAISDPAIYNETTDAYQASLDRLWSLDEALDALNNADLDRLLESINETNDAYDSSLDRLWIIGEALDALDKAEAPKVLDKLRKLADPEIVDGITEYGNELEHIANIMPLVARAAEALIPEKTELEIFTDQWDELVKQVEKYDFALDSAKDTFGALGDLQQNMHDREIKALENVRDKMQQNGQDTAEIDKQIADKKNEFAERQFKSQKMTAIAEAVINGAVAAVGALKLGPAGIPLAVAIGALTTAQVGLIGAQSYVPMAQGGIVNGPTRALIGEAGPEAVIPLRDMDKGIGRGAGGVTVIQNISGSIWQTKELEGLALGAVARANRGY